MIIISEVTTTGSIIPLGDGMTGKSVLTRLLINENMSEAEHLKLMQESKKSLNIEMEFKSAKVAMDGELIKTSLQFYVFPGQRQKISDLSPTFDEILDIFQFMPALKKVSVLLLIYDTTRIESLKSLENWTQVALDQGWISDDTMTILVCNKTDLQKPNLDFVQNVRQGLMKMLRENGQEQASENVEIVRTSGMNKQGIDELRHIITLWIAQNGVRHSSKVAVPNGN